MKRVVTGVTYWNRKSNLFLYNNLIIYADYFLNINNSMKYFYFYTHTYTIMLTFGVHYSESIEEMGI